MKQPQAFMRSLYLIKSIVG